MKFLPARTPSLWRPRPLAAVFALFGAAWWLEGKLVGQDHTAGAAAAFAIAALLGILATLSSGRKAVA